MQMNVCIMNSNIKNFSLGLGVLDSTCIHPNKPATETKYGFYICGMNYKLVMLTK